jgi:TonB-linked SusC/RagA family outer membrane protein
MASAQSITVTGTVVDETGFGLPGVNVLVDGTTSGTVTDIDGQFTLNTTRDAVLVISFTGYETQRIPVDGTSPISVELQPSSALLDEVVVTGYQTQRKRDITGAVSVISSEELTAVAASSVNQQLEGRASGVQVSTSGQAGAGAAVRIRGYSTFGNSDPLLVVDGVPQINGFLNQINPNDIESIQILKDAAAASIYGTRASNGVIIVTTKNGKRNTRPSLSYNGYYGIQTPVRGLDDFLIQDPQDYAQIIFDQFTNQGLTPTGTIYGGEDTGTPILPDYIFPVGNVGEIDESTYSFPDNLIMRANKEGTNWWDEVFDPAPMQDHTVAVSGGSENGSFRISGNYFDQQGTMLYSYFRRFSLRANSQWQVGKLTIGENLNLGRVETVGVDGGNQNEQNTIVNIIKAQPIIPVYDISGVNFASGKSNGLSNVTNPVKRQFVNRNDVGQFDQIQGSVFAAYEVIPGLSAKTQFGFNVGTSFSQNFTDITPENSEPNFTNSYSQNFGRNTDWVWSNTLTYTKTFNDVHDLTVLAGTEAIQETGRSINGSFAQYFITELPVRYLQGGLANPDTRQVSSSGQTTTLSSIFGQFNYAYDNKYLVSATVRRDGSSRFGDEKYGIFPAASLGWRISSEPFLANSTVISDLKLRAGFGVLGNQNIDPYNFFDFYGGGTGNTFFDIAGTNNSLVTGYTATRRGNPLTTWEEKTTINGGFDLSLLDDKFYMVLDLYSTEVDGLLVRALAPRTSGLSTPPFVNVGNMQNRGVDLQIGWRPRINDVRFDISLNASHYRNEITQIDGTRTEFFSGQNGSRIGNLQINRIGNPIGSFFGFVTDGIFQNQSEVDAHADQGGKAVGRLRFADVDGFDEDGARTGQPDGVINDADRVIIGNPHPDLTAGLNIAVNYKNWDFTAFFFGSFGNDVFNYIKIFHDFREFNTNASTALLTDTWLPSRPDATIPQLDVNDVFSRQPSDYYVEDGSYLRAKQLQLGYTLPTSAGGNIFKSLRFYVQAQNLFTITGYSGLDPAFSAFETGDLNIGVDFGNYPANRVWLFGVNAGF